MLRRSRREGGKLGSGSSVKLACRWSSNIAFLLSRPRGLQAFEYYCTYYFLTIDGLRKNRHRLLMEHACCDGLWVHPERLFQSMRRPLYGFGGMLFGTGAVNSSKEALPVSGGNPAKMRAWSISDCDGMLSSGCCRAHR